MTAMGISDGPDGPRTHITLRIIAQDPTVKGDDRKILTTKVRVPWSRSDDGPRTARFHVVDFDASTGKYRKHPAIGNDDLFADVEDKELLTDLEFHAQQVYAVASRTLSTFEQALGRRLSWGFEGHQLFLVPHAFAEANAYYSWDDRALLFGYVPRRNGDPVYTCLSYDVVVHETTHAVLDGLRRRFLEPGLPDQAAFHEGFADVVALLSVFSMRAVVEQALGPAGADGRISIKEVAIERLKRNALAGVAEQVGKVLTQGRGALRRSALKPPPPDWHELPSFQEPHRRGEVLVAVVLDVLIDIWHKRLEALMAGDGGAKTSTIDRARAAEEGAKAATHLLTMLIRGLDYLPPVEFEFGDLLDAVILSDTEIVPDDDLGYRDLLLTRFKAAGITRPRGRTTNVLDGAGAPDYLGLNFAALRTDRNEVFRFLWANADRFDVRPRYPTVVEAVRPSQRVAPDGLIVGESVATYLQSLELTAGELEEISELPLPEGVANETRLQIFGGGTIVFDQFGRAKLHIYKSLDDWRRQMRRLEYLHRSGKGDPARLGFADEKAKDQTFAELHNTGLTTGEAW